MREIIVAHLFLKPKEMSIEENICPEQGKLKIKKGIAEAKIVDVELDILQCYFEEDCVKIDTKKYNHIILDSSNIDDLYYLLDKAKQYYESKKNERVYGLDEIQSKICSHNHK